MGLTENVVKSCLGPSQCYVHLGCLQLSDDEGLSVSKESEQHSQYCLSCAERYKADIWSVSLAASIADSGIDHYFSGAQLHWGSFLIASNVDQWFGPQPQEAPGQHDDVSSRCLQSLGSWRSRVW